MKNYNRFFTVFWLILIASLTASSQNIPTNGLTAHWSFDGNLDNSTLASGNTSPPDPSNLNLTAGGGTGFELNGLFGQAAHFDGIDDYLQLTGAPNGEIVEDDPLPATTTISVWFKADSAPSGTARYMVYETAPNFTLSLGLREGSNTANTKVQAYSDLITGSDPFTSVEIPDSEIAGQWVHALMTLSHDAGGSESLTISVNNNIDATATFEADVSDFQVFGDFHIGTYRISNARWFPGLIDELAVWERELTTQEIDQLATGPTLVTTLTDEDDSPGAGSETSLREAVKYSAGGSIITFDPALSGQTILLTNGQIQINKSLSIDASAIGGISIDGNANGRIFEIASGATSALSGLTITNGLASGSVPGDKGGGIYIRSGAYLALDNAIITGNDGRNYGGGIFNDGTTTVSNCTLTGNSAQLGAAIYNYGSGIITANNSTLANNVAGNEGGGIQNFGNATFNNSTIAGNSAPNNGGGIYSVSSASSVTLNNSIVAGNTALAGADIYDNADNGPTHTVGENIVGNASGYTINSGTAPIIANPLLAPLGDYGGFTPTMPPMAGSPAIDAGGTADFFTDQRGLTRIVNGTVDIGAVERQLPIVLNLADSGYGSLRDVINFADSGTTVIFTNALSGGTIILTSGQILIDKNLAVDASTLPGGITIDGNGSVTGQRVFEFIAGTTNTLDALTITGGRTADANDGSSAENGGGILNAGHLTLLNCNVTNNSTGNGGNGFGSSGNGHGGFGIGHYGGNGGGIYNVSGSLKLKDSTVSGNSTGNGGDGIGGDGSNGENGGLGDGGNGGLGGGIYNVSGSLTLENSTVSGNSTGDGGNGNGGNGGDGGGTFNSGGDGGDGFGGNGGSGGGLYSASGSLTLKNSTTAGNSTGGGGFGLGGPRGIGGSLASDGDNGSGSYGSDGDGGGIYSSLTLMLENATISGNTASGNGGGVLYFDTFNSTNSIIAGNWAAQNPNINGSITAGYNNLTNGIPQLAPLGNYGGPTSTMPPLLGSPAIDAGGITSFAIDQRGAPRFDSFSDIGAVEFQQFIVNTLADETDGIDFNGISLRDAIVSNNEFPPSLILFSPALSNGTILLTNGQFFVEDTLTIDASSIGGLTIDGNAANRIFEVSGSDTVVTLSTLTLTNGLATGNYPDNRGGAIYLHSGADLTLSNAVLSGNTANDDGGGIYNESGTLSLLESTLSGNTANDIGGGIYNGYGTLTLQQSSLSGNTANNDGGGIFSSTSSANAPITSSTTLNQCTLTGNTAVDSGGGMRNFNGWVFMTNCTISANAALTGAGVRTYGDNATETVVNNTIIAGNLGDDLGLDETINPNAFQSGGGNLIGNGTVSYFSAAGDSTNHTAASIRLAPFGDYGGPTQTMPPLPGSPAIDAGGMTIFTYDQRGLNRVMNGALDIGAVEIQDFNDTSSIISSAWATDTDSDGNPFGVEYALGTDWNIADRTNSANLVALPDGGVVFGINLDAEEHTAWIIKRSQNLVTDPFVEVYRYDGPTSSSSGTIPAFVNKTADHIELNDQSGVTNAFYLFEAELNL
ncbi:choice-of-anchor Q domain-containing protein [Pontiellaceae bacterium B1224]|nr:choice-of-anchor Q domain-containing protein [Pontiellaceae bacterium B1224]